MRNLSWFQARDSALQGRKIRRAGWEYWVDKGFSLWYIEGATIPRRVVRNTDFGQAEFFADDWTDESWIVDTPPIVCGAGYHYDPNAGACIPDNITGDTICKEGWHYNGAECVKNDAANVCRDGYELVAGVCQPKVAKPGSTPLETPASSGGGGGGGAGTQTPGGGTSWAVISPVLPSADGGGGGKKARPHQPKPPGTQKPGQIPTVPVGGDEPTVTMRINTADVQYGPKSGFNRPGDCWTTPPTSVSLPVQAAIAGGPNGSGTLKFQCTGQADVTKGAGPGSSLFHVFDSITYSSGTTLTVTVTYTTPGGVVKPAITDTYVMSAPACSGGGSGSGGGS
jgi:hypothetical protein